jgi:predicted Zn-dependent peptidase
LRFDAGENSRVEASVRGFSDRELVAFFRRFYVADNLTLVVAGDVDPARVRRIVERRFRAMPSGRPARLVASEPVQTAPRASATMSLRSTCTP